MSSREVRWESSEVVCLVQWTLTFIFTFSTGNNHCRLFALLLYTLDKVYFIFNLVPSICYLVFYYSSRRFLLNSDSKYINVNSFFMLAHPFHVAKVEVKAIIILMKDTKKMHRTRLQFVFLSYLIPVHSVSL